MAKKSKIESLGLGDKILAYATTGMSCNAIAKKVNAEHENANLNHRNVQLFLDRRKELVIDRRREAVNNSITLTLDSVKSTLIEAVEEIRTYLEEFGDNPKHAAAGLKLKLDAIEKMAKMLGGYAPEHQVNVQVNNVYNQENFERGLKESEEYFDSLERVGDDARDA